MAMIPIDQRKLNAKNRRGKWGTQMQLASVWNEPSYCLEGASRAMRSAGELELRRLELQRSVIGPDLINTPAWAILVLLLAQGNDAGVLPLRAIAAELQMHERSALRWVSAMETEDLVQIQKTHFGDHIGLTNKANVALCEYFQETAHAHAQETPKAGVPLSRHIFRDFAVGGSLTVFMSALFMWPLISLSGR